MYDSEFHKLSGITATKLHPFPSTCLYRECSSALKCIDVSFLQLILFIQGYMEKIALSTPLRDVFPVKLLLKWNNYQNL